jgi:hypothetical protein
MSWFQTRLTTTTTVASSFALTISEKTKPGRTSLSSGNDAKLYPVKRMDFDTAWAWTITPLRCRLFRERRNMLIGIRMQCRLCMRNDC